MRVKRISVYLLVTTLLAMSAAGIVACGSADNAGSGSGAGSAASQEATPEGGIPKEDVVGVWHVFESSAADYKVMEDAGMFFVFQFDDDGTFTNSIIIRDASLDRVGTYEIRDGKIYVNLPELEKSESKDENAAIKSLSADAIENAELTLEDGILTTNQFADDGTTIKAEKMTDKEYEKLKKKAASMGPKDVKVGKEIKGDFYTFTVDSLEFVDEVYPSDTSGYFRYYQHQDGKSYLTAMVSYTNTGKEYAMPCYATEATFTVGGNKYEASIEIDGGANFSAAYEVAAQDTAKMVICAAVPDKVKDSGDVKLTWSIPKDVGMMQTYHSYSSSNDEYVVTM